MEEISNRVENASMKRMLHALIPQDARPENVGPRIRAVRLALDIKPSEFADAIGLDRSSLTKIEKGSMGLSIANALRIETLYGVGIRFTYRNDFRDVPEELRERVLKALAAPDTK